MMTTNQTESECCICLDEFKTPRVLPCIHTFCEECLQTHILQRHTRNQSYGFKWTSFPCPMCRHICKLPELNEHTSIAGFVKYYPINYYTNLKTCAKHESKVINMLCMTSGIDMCVDCITDGHIGCLVSIRKGAKKQAIETLVGVLNGIIEAVSPWTNHRLILGNTNEKKKAEEKRFNYLSEKYIRLEKKMTILQERALKMQENICKTISAIDDSQENYIFSNAIGDANSLKRQLLETFENLQIHATKQGKCLCLLLGEFDSKLNLANSNEIDLDRNASTEEPIPKEISYFLLSSKNRTECRKILNMKVLVDCSVVVLCQTPNKLVKLSWCGEFISELLFNNEPSDMCLKEDGEIAVSFSYRQRIDFVDVSESQLRVTMSFETLRLYQRIATCGPNGLLACHSEKIDVLKKFNNSLNVVKTISLFDSIQSFDYINDIIIFSTYGHRHIYSYDIAKNRLGIYYLVHTIGKLPVDISCSPNTIYSLFTKVHIVYRMKTPDKVFNESTGHLLLRIGKPHKIHVNNSKAIAVCSTNRNTDRFLVQIFKYSNLTEDFWF